LYINGHNTPFLAIALDSTGQESLHPQLFGIRAVQMQVGKDDIMGSCISMSREAPVTHPEVSAKHKRNLQSQRQEGNTFNFYVHARHPKSFQDADPEVQQVSGRT
jgi:hypothetical protein